MRRKTISEVLHKVDPNLKVIDGGYHRSHRKKRQLAIMDWDSTTGVVCSECKEETLRIIDGLCPQCHKAKVMERESKLEEKRERHYYREQLRKGTISLAQMREGRL